MGILDAFNPEDRVSVKFSDFYKLMLEGTKAELMMNAVKCDVPHQHIREMMTGNKEPVKTCGQCKHCKPDNVCGGDHICEAKHLDVSADDDTSFYAENDGQPCEEFTPAD